MTEFVLLLFLSLLIFWLLGATFACYRVLEDYYYYNNYGLKPKGNHPKLYAVRISLIWFVWMFNEKKYNEYTVYYYS